MKTERMLRSLIREISSELPTAAPVVPQQKGKIYLAGRDISFDMDIGFHAWIIVRHPEDPKGTLRTYSGKSGVGFEMGVATAALRKMFTGDARDERADRVVNALRNVQKFKSDTAAYQEAMKDTTWGPLLKLKNWDADAIGKADEIFELVPLAAPGVTDDQILRACNQIEAAFHNYTQDVPYDPVPQLSSNKSTRNSNSFAFTLMKLISPNRSLQPGNFSTDKYPGWGFIVPGLQAPSR
jgi:hypothetical protein